MRYLFLSLMVLVGVGVGSSAEAQTSPIAYGFCIDDTVAHVLMIETSDGRGTDSIISANVASSQVGPVGTNDEAPVYSIFTLKDGPAITTGGGFWSLKTDTRTNTNAYRFGKITCYTDIGNSHDFVCKLNNVATPCTTFE